MDKVIVGIASIRSRRSSLKRVIRSLSEQTVKPDKINVYLNDTPYNEIPNFLKKKNINVFTSQDYGDLGDAGKFFLAGKVESSYYFSCDDDLNYPPQYIEYMISGIEKYDRKYVVALHGRILKYPVTNFFTDRRILNFKKYQKEDIKAHLPGTGVTAFHSDTLKLSIDDFPVKNMADIWFGLQCQRQGVGIVVLKHQPRWVGVLPNTNNGSIFHSSHKNLEIIKRNTDATNSIAEWKI